MVALIVTRGRREIRPITTASSSEDASQVIFHADEAMQTSKVSVVLEMFPHVRHRTLLSIVPSKTSETMLRRRNGFQSTC